MSDKTIPIPVEPSDDEDEYLEKLDSIYEHYKTKLTDITAKLDATNTELDNVDYSKFSLEQLQQQQRNLDAEECSSGLLWKDLKKCMKEMRNFRENVDDLDVDKEMETLFSQNDQEIHDFRTNIRKTVTSIKKIRDEHEESKKGEN